MYRHTASPVSLWPKVSGLRSGCPLSNLSVSLRSPRPGCGSQRLLRCRLHPAGRCPNSDSLFPPLAAVVAVAPGRGASGEEAKLCGMPRPPLGRGGGTASAVTERLSPARAIRSGHPSSNLSVCFADSSPGRGASGEEAKLCGMPRPPLGRGGGTASAVTERLSPARAIRSGHPSSNLSVCFADSSPGRGASGEEAKLCGMPRPPLGRGGGTASAVTERLSPARAIRSGHPSSNLSVCFADSSPGRGASGEEAKLCGMPRPPLGRGGGTASAVTERLSPSGKSTSYHHLLPIP